MTSGFVLGKSPLLPVAAYTSQDWFDREQELIFGRSWQCIGVLSDLPNPGDYFTVQAGRNALFVVRGDDRRLRAFHNVCRHRGTQLLRASGQAQTGIVCPYHNWTYSINGDLLSVPQPECLKGLEFSERSLHPASVDSWNGLIFVHPDPDPPETLIGWLGDFPDKFGPHQPELLTETDPDIHEWRANWKIVVENYVDGYHLMHLHADTLSMYDHLKAQTSFHNRHFAFWEPPVEEFRQWLDRNRSWWLKHLAEDDYGAYVHMLWPCTGLVGMETSWSLFRIFPQGPELTRVEIRSWAEDYGTFGKLYNAMGSWSGGSGSGNDPLSSGDFMEEDSYACEQQQKGMHSPMFGVGASAERYEDGVLGFQRNVAAAMGVAVDA